jgi:hypothetical protein
MAEAEGIPPTASVASPGLSLNYVGDWVYAYSGEIAVASSGGEVTLLEDVSGAGIVVGDYQFFYGVSSTNEFIYRMYFNDVIGMSYMVTNLRESTPDVKIGVIMPPYTRIKLTAQNLSADTGRLQAATLIGRVYGAA